MRVTLALLFFPLLAVASPDQEAASLYADHCAQCHEHDIRAPRRATLGKLSPTRIAAALETGSMRNVGSTLSASERQSLANFLGNPTAGGDSPAPLAGQCDKVPRHLNLEAPHWNGWGASLVNDRFEPRHAGLTQEQVGSLKLKWAFGFDGEPWAASQPVVVDGRVFIGSASGRVYALDLRRGCIDWTFQADTPVRAAITVGPSGAKSSGLSAFFTDALGNAYRLDANTGRLVWKLHVESHQAARTVGSPQLYHGRLYVPVSSFEEVLGSNPKYECCTFRGSIAAIDAISGKLAWRAYSIDAPLRATRRNSIGTQLYGPSGAATYSAPTIDAHLGRLYFTTGNSYSEPAADTSDAVLGVDLGSGHVVWATQLTPGDAFNVSCMQPDTTNCPDKAGGDFDFASPAILITTPQNKRLLIASQKAGMVYALDPDDSGRKIWSTRVAAGGLLGGVMWGAATDGDTIYVAVSDAFELGKLNPDAGGLVALRSSDGKQLWRIPAPPCARRDPCLPAQTAAVTLIPGVVFSGSRDGFLRAYSSLSGRLLWQFDTARKFETVNGVKAQGGTLDVAGVTVVDGMVLTTSGYSQFGGIPGNVLLAFSALNSN